MEHPCAGCGAILAPHVTYCLACDTPVEGARDGLSVGPMTVTRVGRPRHLIVPVVAAVVLIGGGATVAAVAAHRYHVRGEDQAAAHVRSETTDILRAEAGDRTGCHRLVATMKRPAAAERVRQECLGLVGSDPGMTAGDLRVDRIVLSRRTGSVRLRATLSDPRGTHALDRTVAVARVGGTWSMRWDGEPLR